MSLPFKTCPECGAEYVHAAVVCVACNVALEMASTRPSEPAATTPLPAASELTRIAAGGPWEMQQLALELQAAGISCRIDPIAPTRPPSREVARVAPRGSSGSSARLALYVLGADVEPARRLIESRLLGESSGEFPQATDEGGGLEVCPACAAPITSSAAACSDCGLEFVSVEDVCSSCGSVLPAEATTCPSCGASSTGAA